MMLNAIMGSPEFDGWEAFAPPFGITLYYIYNFVIIVILLNILIALYNSAYEDITGNATDEVSSTTPGAPSFSRCLTQLERTKATSWKTGMLRHRRIF